MTTCHSEEWVDPPSKTAARRFPSAGQQGRGGMVKGELGKVSYELGVVNYETKGCFLNHYRGVCDDTSTNEMRITRRKGHEAGIRFRGTEKIAATEETPPL